MKAQISWLSATLGTPRVKQEVTVRCTNLGTESLELKAGTVIGIYQPVEDDEIERVDVRAKSVPGICQKHVARCPENFRPLLKQT